MVHLFFSFSLHDPRTTKISQLHLFSNFLFLGMYNIWLLNDLIVSSILNLLPGIYADVGGGVGTCTRACSCACTTCTTAS